jgi:hypothetical protein
MVLQFGCIIKTTKPSFSEVLKVKFRYIIVRDIALKTEWIYTCLTSFSELLCSSKKSPLRSLSGSNQKMNFIETLFLLFSQLPFCILLLLHAPRTRFS